MKREFESALSPAFKPFYHMSTFPKGLGTTLSKTCLFLKISLFEMQRDPYRKRQIFHSRFNAHQSWRWDRLNVGRVWNSNLTLPMGGRALTIGLSSAVCQGGHSQGARIGTRTKTQT